MVFVEVALNHPSSFVINIVGDVDQQGADTALGPTQIFGKLAGGAVCAQHDTGRNETEPMGMALRGDRENWRRRLRTRRGRLQGGLNVPGGEQLG